MRYFLLALFVFSLTAGDAPPAPPSPVKSVLDAYEADALKAFLAYKQAAAKAADKAAKDMDAKLKAATKAGNLDAANAIKAEMDKLNKGETLAAMEDKWKDAGAADLLNAEAKKKDPKELLVGKWHLSTSNGANMVLEFDDKGNVKGPEGMWDYQIVKGKLLVRGGNDSYPLPVADLMTGVSLSNGVVLTLKRIK